MMRWATSPGAQSAEPRPARPSHRPATRESRIGCGSRMCHCSSGHDRALSQEVIGREPSASHHGPQARREATGEWGIAAGDRVDRQLDIAPALREQSLTRRSTASRLTVGRVAPARSVARRASGRRRRVRHLSNSRLIRRGALLRPRNERHADSLRLFRSGRGSELGAGTGATRRLLPDKLGHDPRVQSIDDSVDARRLLVHASSG
jgi:hypothetical protein